jgi:hypothetical protein
MPDRLVIQQSPPRAGFFSGSKLGSSETQAQQRHPKDTAMG